MVALRVDFSCIQYMTGEHSDGWSLVRTCTFLLNAAGKHSMVAMKAGGIAQSSPAAKALND